MKKLLLLASLLVIVGVGFLRLGAEQPPQESLTPVQAVERVEDEPAPPELQAQDTHKQRIAQVEAAEAPTPEPTATTTGFAAETAPALQADASSAPMRVEVLVIDSLGQPIPGAVLALETVDRNSAGGLLAHIQSRGSSKTTTNKLGRAILAVNQLDRLRVTARAEGFAIGASSVFRVTESTPKASVEIQITEGGSVAGRLRDIHGQPAEAIQLSIHLITWPGEYARGVTSVMQQMKTDAEGAFLFPHLVPGRHNLYIRAKGEDIERVPTQTLNVLVVDGVTTQVEFEDLAQSHVVVSGVVSCNDQPVRDARLSVISTDNGNRSTKVDEAGQFQIILDRGGEYTFAIGSKALGGTAIKKINVPTVASHHVELRFFTGAISGRVVDTNGKPVPDYPLMAFGRSDAGSGVARAKTDESGEYLFNDLLTGTYKITSARSLLQPRSEPTPGPAYLGSATVKDLVLTRGSSLRGVDLQLPAASAVATTVFDSAGDPAKGALVKLQFVGTYTPGVRPPGSSRGQTNAQGVHLAGGLSPGMFQARATLGDQVTRPMNVEALLDTTASLELHLEPGVRVHCTTLQNGESGKTGFAQLTDADGRVVASAYSQDGQLELGPVLPGSYTIRGSTGPGGEKLKGEQPLTIVGFEPVSIELDLR